MRGRLRTRVARVEAKLRYRSPALPASVTPVPDGFALDLDEPAYGVAKGQIAVLYDGDAVVGSGVIRSTSTTKIARCPSRSRTPTSRTSALTLFLVLIGLGIFWVCVKLGGACSGTPRR